MYDPTEGEILWDGIDIREFDPTEFRNRIGAIFQDFIKYELTAWENIGMGDIQRIKDPLAMENAAKKSGIHYHINRLPDGYSTWLSRRQTNGKLGVDLSGGEWQKMALARMLMKTTDVVILDEPTAALDIMAEYNFFKSFRALVSDQTSLLISHRFGTVRMSDRIAMLENGRIIEMGSHDELIALQGKYAKLFFLQTEQMGIQVQ